VNTSTKPYFIRAIHEWAEDNGFTAHVLVDAFGDGVVVPNEHVKDGQILLNIAHTAVQLDCMDNEKIAFTARFNGVSTNIELPIESIKAIYARENGQGLFFDETPNPDGPDGKSQLESKAEKSASDTAVQSVEKSRSHLKVIK
jgi:stringent starvation protein B